MWQNGWLKMARRNCTSGERAGIDSRSHKKKALVIGLQPPTSIIQISLVNSNVIFGYPIQSRIGRL